MTFIKEYRERRSMEFVKDLILPERGLLERPVHDKIFSCSSPASSLSIIGLLNRPNFFSDSSDQMAYLATQHIQSVNPLYTHLVLRGPNSCNYQLISINFQELRSHMTDLTKCNGGQNVISPLAITSYRLCCLLC